MKEIKGHITLDRDATQSLSNMYQEIKSGGEFVKITPSMLASWIVKHFHRASFGKERAKIRKAYLDRKKWLSKALERTEDDGLENFLKSALADVVKEKRKAKIRPLKS